MMLDILLFYGIIAVVFTFGKQALNAGSPFFICALRLIPAGLIFLIGVYFFDRKNFFIKKNAIKSLIGLIIFVFFMDVFRFVGLAYVSSSYGALLSTLSPFIASLFAWYHYKEPLSFKKIVALCLGALAVIPIILSNLTGPMIESKLFIIIGYGALFISTTAVVIRTFFLKDLIDTKKHAIFMILGCTFVFVGSAALVLSLLYEPWNPIPCTNFSLILPHVLLLTVSYNIFAQPLYAYLVKKYPVTLVTFFMFATPLITALLNRLLYKQPIHTVFIFSCAILIVAFIIFYKEEKYKKFNG